MAYIKVNYQKMKSAADQIDNYVARLDKDMRTIDGAVLSLGTEWKGEDYQQVRAQWNEMNDSGSTTDRMRASLKSYAGAIRQASRLYKDAQARALNRANTLCK